MRTPGRLRVLVAGGHDQSGAGLDADRAAIADLDLEIVCVVTAWTEQDERAVRSIGAREPRDWLDEACAAVTDGVAAIKLGLLPGASHVHAATALVRHARERLGEEVMVVVDPVLAASSGGRFLDSEAVEALRGELFGLRVIVTPNLAEAAELAQLAPKRLQRILGARSEAARILLGLGCAAVVLKGGHGDEDPVQDLVADASGQETWLEHQRTPRGKIRGSGCRFAARLAGRLAQGQTLVESARDAAQHVAAAIARGASAGGP